MNDWFGEKSSQIEPCVLKAFGIEIFSRYGQSSELIQMMQFAEECAKRKVEHYVQKVFYDSKACMCSFELDDAVKEGDAVANAIHAAASETIGQYLWFDMVEHCGELIDQY